MSLFPRKPGDLRRRSVARLALGIALLATSAAAQTPAPSTTLVEPPTPLLPQQFGAWTSVAATSPNAAPHRRLGDIGDAVLKECGQRRTLDRSYQRDGHVLHVEAIEFTDATGASSAFTLELRPGMRLGQDVGRQSAVGSGEALFASGDTLVLASPVEGSSVGDLRALESTLPKISGPRGLAPLLPTLLPSKGLDRDTIRYTLGPSSYQTAGGTLPPEDLGFGKAAEAATARYTVAGHPGTLTLLLYPTPEIAGERGRAIEKILNDRGDRAGNAKLRREGPLVLPAQGLPPEAAAVLIDSVHLHSEVTWNKQMVPEFHAEVRKTASLLVSIAWLSGILGLAAIVIGLFLGIGRAWIRTLLGKPAASEPEFLRLGLRGGPVTRLEDEHKLGTP